MPLLLSPKFHDILRALLNEIDDLEKAAQTTEQTEDGITDSTAGFHAATRKFFKHTRCFSEEIELVKEEERRRMVAVRSLLNPADAEPLRFGDLQQGERYLHMDWIFAQAISPYLPRWHISSHAPLVQTSYDSAGQPRFLGVGLTDGEAVERAWAALNPLTSRAPQMGPGERQDTLDDSIECWNRGKKAAVSTKM
ncbi:hypothetical protein C8R43DRAFT_1122002 [Mycena crocata]|nr:hypothetical protein C8R43DRAFT_1122002 [Mycena crocata]